MAEDRTKNRLKEANKTGKAKNIKNDSARR